MGAVFHTVPRKIDPNVVVAGDRSCHAADIMYVIILLVMANVALAHSDPLQCERF